MDLNYTDIGMRIRAARKSRRLTQANLGEMANVEPSNISHIERAATKLSLPTLVSIANALGVTLDELVCGSLIKNKHITNKNIDNLISDCSPDELKAISEMIKTTKKIIREYK